MRSVTTISAANTVDAATRFKQELHTKVEAKVAVEDGRVRFSLQEKYMGALFWDEDTALKVAGVHLTQWAGEGYWIVASVPITCVNGAWKVPAKRVVGESSGGNDDVYIHDSLQHFDWKIKKPLFGL